MELEELFESYLSQNMSEADSALFEKLLKDNPEYQVQFHAFQEKSKGKHTKKSPAKRSSIKTWSISAAIAVAIVLVGYFLIKTLSMPPGEKLFMSFYEPKQVSNSASYADNQELSRAIATYQNQEFEEAEALFGKLKSENESDLTQLYLGLSQLAIDRPEKAIPTLSLISPESDFFLEANWYMAMGFLKLNKLEEAEKHLEISASKPNPYSEKASEVLLKLR